VLLRMGPTEKQIARLTNRLVVLLIALTTIYSTTALLVLELSSTLIISYAR
jgi:hypothetical protein